MRGRSATATNAGRRRWHFSRPRTEGDIVRPVGKADLGYKCAVYQRQLERLSDEIERLATELEAAPDAIEDVVLDLRTLARTAAKS